jgi:hypothetical protein
MILRFTMEDFTKILDEEKRREASRKHQTCIICNSTPSLNTEKEKRDFAQTDLCAKCQAASYSGVAP